MHGHVFVRHIRRQFILQTVNVNENAVQFFFVLFELLEAFFALGLPSSIFLGNQSSHMSDPLFVLCPQLGQDLLVVGLAAGNLVKVAAGRFADRHALSGKGSADVAEIAFVLRSNIFLGSWITFHCSSSSSSAYVT